MNSIFKTVQMFPTEEKAIQRIFGVSRSPYWGIIDRYEEEKDNKKCYIMLHYNPELISDLIQYEEVSVAEKRVILNFRGVVIDVSEEGNEKIVSVSFGYTPDIPLLTDEDQIPEELFDTNHTPQSSFLKDSSVTIHPAYEGTVIRAWKYNNKVFFSTHKKINPVNSSFGKSEKFLALYDKLGGPSGDILFDVQQESSNLIHSFMICDKNLLFTSKIDVSDGFLVYLGQKSIDSKIVEKSYWKPQLSTVEVSEDDLGYPSGDKNNRCIYSPPFLTKEQADLVLKYGSCYYAKSRIDTNKHSFLKTGEPVIMIKRDSEGNPLSMCRIVPDAYYQKTKILDQNPNFLNRSFIINDITHEGKKEYKELFPVVGAPTLEEFKECKTILSDVNLFTYPSHFTRVTKEQLEGDSEEAKDLRFRNALICMILSVPTHAQQEACDFYQNYQERKDKIYNFISSNYSHLQDIFVNHKISVKESPLLGKVMWYKDKVTPACMAVERLVVTSSNGTKEQKVKYNNKALPNVVSLNNLKKLVNKEYGIRSYQLSQAIINSEKVKQ